MYLILIQKIKTQVRQPTLIVNFTESPMKLYSAVFLFVSLFFSMQSYSKEAPQPEDCKKLNIDACITIADELYDRDEVEEAIKYYKPLCELEVGHGCRRVGLIHEYADTEPTLVKKMYEKSCSLGDMTGCNNLGLLYQEDEEYDKANELLRQACDGNDQYGCYHLGLAYEYERGVKENNKKASNLFIKSCDLGYSEACDSAGNLYYFTYKKYKTALKWYKKGCELDDGRGCYDAGYQYEEGDGVKKNMSTANEFYKKGCDLRDADSCTQLGRAYMEYDEPDPKIKKDYAKGTKLLRLGCEMGDGLGCSGLGYAYHNGLGVEDDEKKALEMHLYGCNDAYDASEEACYNVGWIYDKGSVIKRDLKLARLYYTKACDDDHDDACESLEALE